MEETISRESEFSPAPVHGALSSQEDVTVSKEVMSACLRNGICVRDGRLDLQTQALIGGPKWVKKAAINISEKGCVSVCNKALWPVETRLCV